MEKCNFCVNGLRIKIKKFVKLYVGVPISKGLVKKNRQKTC